MKIKILNKNPINNDYSNPQSYNIDDGFTITKTYNETLDSAVIRISQLTSEIDIEPYDEVVLFGDSRFGTLYFCVDSIDITQVGINTTSTVGSSEITYTYDITLFSQTKLLENKILPNLSITNNINKRSIWYYLNQYLEEFGEEIRIQSTTYKDYTTSETVSANTAGTHTVSFVLPSTYTGYTYDDRDFEEEELFIYTISTQQTGVELDVERRGCSYNPTTRTVTIEYTADVAHDDFTLEFTMKNMYYTGWSWQPRFSYNSAVQTKFSAITCPEMQWNEPTLREVINDLMMVGNCIPTLNNGVIGYMDLTATNGEIDRTYVNYIKKSKTSDDYVSDIKMNMKNVMQTQLTGITNTTITTEYLTLISDESKLTSDNGYLKTQFPILSIKHLYMYVPIATDVTTSGGEIESSKEKYAQIDLANVCDWDDTTKVSSLVSEYKEYITKKTLYRLTDDETDRSVQDYLSQYQNYCIYYNRGSNVISGFNNSTKGHTGTATYTTLHELKFFCGWNEWKRRGLGTGTTLVSAAEILSYLDTAVGDRITYPMSFFQVEYETMIDQTFSAGKTDYPTNYKEIVDNQTNSWVDSYRQGLLEYQKANRLGNPIVRINQRIESGTPIGLAQTYEDNIVFEAQYQVYDNHVETNAYATKNYVLQNYFTGINSKIRTWANATDEAFKRNELVKYYCEFDYSSHVEKLPNVLYSSNQMDYFMNCLQLFSDTKTPYPLKYVLVQTNNGVYYPSNSTYYSLNLISRIMGNSLVFSFGFDDNAYVGKGFKRETDANSTIITYHSCDKARSATIEVEDVDDYGGVPFNQYKYTKDNFETTMMFWKLTSKIYLTESVASVFTPTTSLETATLNVFDKPIVKSSELNTTYSPMYFNQDYYFHKDNREIPVVNLQYEFCSNTREIYFTRHFLQNQRAICTEDRSSTKLYTSSTFNYGSETLPTGASEITTTTLNLYTVSNTCNAYIQTANNITVGQYLYITDENDNVMLAYKIKDNRGTLYLNLIKKRNKIIYNNNKVRIGGI